MSEAKKFSTESAWMVVNHATQILGGIGYTDIYPVERLERNVNPRLLAEVLLLDLPDRFP